MKCTNNTYCIRITTRKMFILLQIAMLILFT